MTDSAEKMARLDLVITNLMDIFMEYKYGIDDSKKTNLDKDELRNMLKIEIKSDDIQDKIKSTDIDEALNLMGDGSDEAINFRMFSVFVSHLARCYFRRKSGKSGKRCKDCKCEDKNEGKDEGNINKGNDEEKECEPENQC